MTIRIIVGIANHNVGALRTDLSKSGTHWGQNIGYRVAHPILMKNIYIYIYIYIYIRIWKINTSSTIIPAYATYMKTLPRVATREWIYPLLQRNYVSQWEPTEAQLWLVKLGQVFGKVKNIYSCLTVSYCKWIFYRTLPLKALLVYADCMTISGIHRIILSQRSITIMVRRTQEAVLCYRGQTQAWLHTLTEQPNFWTRAIRMWSHNSSHRANLNLWLRALSVLAYFVRVGAGRFFR